MAQRIVNDCEFCTEETGPSYFRMSFEELSPPDPEHLTEASPEGLLMAAQGARERAKELEVPNGTSEHERAFMQAAQEEEKTRLAGEAQALEAEADRVGQSVAILREMADRMEPFVAFGSGSLEFCNPHHAIAYLIGRYPEQAMSAIEAVKNPDRQPDTLAKQP